MPRSSGRQSAKPSYAKPKQTNSVAHLSASQLAELAQKKVDEDAARARVKKFQAKNLFETQHYKEFMLYLRQLMDTDQYAFFVDCPTNLEVQERSAIPRQLPPPGSPDPKSNSIQLHHPAPDSPFSKLKKINLTQMQSSAESRYVTDRTYSPLPTSIKCSTAACTSCYRCSPLMFVKTTRKIAWDKFIFDITTLTDQAMKLDPNTVNLEYKVGRGELGFEANKLQKEAIKTAEQIKARQEVSSFCMHTYMHK